MTSKDTLKKYVLKYNIYMPIMELYNDEEVCSKVDCEFFKKIQLVARPINKVKDYDEYLIKLRKYAYEYLFGDNTAEEVLRNIYDITQIYYLSINTKDTPIGLILLTINITIGIITLLSLSFLYIKKFEHYFKFFTKDSWHIFILGVIFILIFNFLFYGPQTVCKCHLKVFTLSIGYTLCLVSIFHKLIINYPEENKVSKWIEKHKYFFLSVFVKINVSLNILSMRTPISVQTIISKERKNYQICKVHNNFGMYMILLNISIHFIIVLSIGFLSFIEWNIKETFYDVRYVVSALYSNGFCTITIFILVYITIDNYILYNLLFQVICITIALSNFLTIYIFRILRYLFHGDDEESILISDLINRFKSSSLNFSNNQVHSCNSGMMVKSITSEHSSQSIYNSRFSKLVDYHFRTSISSSISKLEKNKKDNIIYASSYNKLF